MKLIAILLSISFYSKAQDSTFIQNPHQIGIDASKFIVLLNEQTNGLDLNYRWNVPKNATSLRFGISYEQNTADDGQFSGSLKLGIDKYFKQADKWSFYYGFDAFIARTVINSSERTTVRYGGFLFLGILYHIGSHFSISTEPNISLLRVRQRDRDSFDPEANREFFTSSIGNIGQIQINFHF